MSGSKPYLRKGKYLTPETMWEHFCAYKDEIKSNPMLVHDFVGKDGDSVERKKERPLTMEGYENYLADKNIIQDIGDYLSNNGGDYAEFISVVKRIKRVIRQDQIEGGMCMVYNPAITQRLNNLVEKTENKHEVSEIIIKREG